MTATGKSVGLETSANLCTEGSRTELVLSGMWNPDMCLCDIDIHALESFINSRLFPFKGTHRPDMNPVTACSVALLSAFILYFLYKWATRISLAAIPGPEAESFWLG